MRPYGPALCWPSRCRGNGRFPYTRMTGGLIKIIVSDNVCADQYPGPNPGHPPAVRGSSLQQLADDLGHAHDRVGHQAGPARATGEPPPLICPDLLVLGAVA